MCVHVCEHTHKYICAYVCFHAQCYEFVGNHSASGGCLGPICWQPYFKIHCTVHNMLVDDKFFCITFTFEWTF